MSLTTASKNSLSFDIKSTLLPLESVIIRSKNLDQVINDLQSRFSKHPDFFDNDPVLLDLTHTGGEEGSEIFDLAELYQVLKKYKMNPVALRSNSASHQAWAELAGLFLISDSQLGPPKKIPPAKTQETINHSASAQNHELNAPQQPSNEPALALTPAPTSALIIDKPLRSGQHVYAKGRDLVVMAMVNPGAEIMADGHIHVYAPLRGKAIAGARGNQEARIYTTCLEAELLSIAGIYRTSDTPIPKEVAGKPAQVRLIDEKLVMQPN
jgi:septum site-determining protein MinC